MYETHELDYLRNLPCNLLDNDDLFDSGIRMVGGRADADGRMRRNDYVDGVAVRREG